MAFGVRLCKSPARAKRLDGLIVRSFIFSDGVVRL